MRQEPIRSRRPRTSRRYAGSPARSRNASCSRSPVSGTRRRSSRSGVFDALAKAELLGITVAEQYGGAGLADVEAAIVLEELARADVSSAILAQLIYNGPPRAIQHLGSDAMRDRWLPMAAAGEALFCIGISETEAGSAVNHMRARLTPDGDGFRLNAYKNYVTGGHKSRCCLVWCRFPDSEAGTTKGIGAVVVDLEAPGVTIAGTHVKMGLRGTSEAELAFDGVRVEPDDVLVWGDAANSDGFKTLIAHINHERCGNAAMCVGAAQGVARVRDRVHERAHGGQASAVRPPGSAVEDRRHGDAARGRPTPVAARRAPCRAERHAAAARDRDGEDRGEPRREVRVRRVDSVARRLRLLASTRSSACYRDIRGLCIGAGTVEIQRNFIGRAVLDGTRPRSAGWK